MPVRNCTRVLTHAGVHLVDFVGGSKLMYILQRIKQKIYCVVDKPSAVCCALGDTSSLQTHSWVPICKLDGYTAEAPLPHTDTILVPHPRELQRSNAAMQHHVRPAGRARDDAYTHHSDRGKWSA